MIRPRTTDWSKVGAIAQIVGVVVTVLIGAATLWLMWDQSSGSPDGGTTPVPVASWMPWVIAISMLGTGSLFYAGMRVRLSASTPATEARKLSIHSAFYGAPDAGGRDYDVTEVLQSRAMGESLVLDVENQNFVIGDRNFVPADPKVGTKKRLKVDYSHGSWEVQSIERPEGSRLVLPQDSWTTGELQRITTIAAGLERNLSETCSNRDDLISQVNAANARIRDQTQRISELESKLVAPGAPLHRVEDIEIPLGEYREYSTSGSTRIRMELKDIRNELLPRWRVLPPKAKESQSDVASGFGALANRIASQEPETECVELRITGISMHPSLRTKMIDPDSFLLPARDTGSEAEASIYTYGWSAGFSFVAIYVDHINRVGRKAKLRICAV